MRNTHFRERAAPTPVVFFLLALTVLFAPSLRAQSFTWNGGNANWTSSANWGGGPPGPTDTATINSGTVMVTSPITVGTLNLTGGTLTGGGTLTVSVALNWSGGTMSGTGSTTVNGGTLAINTGSNPVTLSQRTLVNNPGATGTWVGNTQMNIDTGGIFQNNGIFDLQNTNGQLFFGTGGGSIVNSGGSTFTKSTGNVISIRNGTGTGMFNNMGTLSATGGFLNLQISGTSTGGNITASGTGTLGLGGAGLTVTLDPASSLTGNGAINFQGGTIAVQGGSNFSGTTTISAGTVTYSGSVMTVASSLFVTGGSLNLGNSLSTVSSFYLQGGSLTVGNTLKVSSFMQWNNGAILGIGSVQMMNGASIQIDTTTNPVNLSQATLSLLTGSSGTWVGDMVFDIDSNGLFSNSGTFDCQNNNGMLVFGAGGGSPGVINSGMFKKTIGAGTLIRNGAGTGQFVNNGTVSVQSGGVNIACSGSATGGTFSVAASTTLAMGGMGTLYTLNATSSITGAGQVVFPDGMTNVMGTYNVSGLTTLQFGTVTLAGPITNLGSMLSIISGSLDLKTNSAAVGMFTMNGGSLAGSGVLTAASGFLWTGGVMSGSGTTQVANTGSLQIDTTDVGVVLSQRTLINGGTGTWIGDNIVTMDTAAQFTNNGTLDCQNVSGFLGFGNGGGTITNNGMFLKTTGAFTEIANNPGTGTFNNNSSVSVTSGVMTFGCAVFGVGATYSVTSPNQITFANSGNFNPASTLSGDGVVDFSSGTFNVQGNYNVTGVTVVDGGAVSLSGTVQSLGSAFNLSLGMLDLRTNNASVSNGFLSGGILTGSGTLTVSGVLTWTGGTMSGTGTTIVSGTGTCTISTNGTVNRLSQRTLINQGGVGTWSGTTGGFWIFDSGAVFTNSGSFTSLFTGASRLQFQPGGGTINNNGTWMNQTTGTNAIEDNGGTGAFNNSNLLLLQGGTLLINTVFKQTTVQGTILLAGGSLMGNTLNIQGGAVSGSGTIAANVNNTGGFIAPGTGGATGVVKLMGNYTQTAGGNMVIRIGGTGPTQFDQFNISGLAALSGGLTLQKFNNFAPASPNIFTFLTSASVSGTFATVTNPTALSVNYAAQNVSLGARGGTAPSITSPSSATFAVAALGNFSITTTGTATVVISESGTLPTGVTFKDNGDGTGTLTGTPAAGTAGSYPVTIIAANGAQPNATQNFTLTVNATTPLTITSFASSENPAFFGDNVTFSFSATDSFASVLNYALDFGDGTLPVKGTFLPGGSASVVHGYAQSGSNPTVTLTVSDMTLQTTQTLVQMLPAPASGGMGVPNISNNVDPVTNPLDNLGIAVANSNGGVVQLAIDIGSLTRANYNVTTTWGDVSGRSATVTGTKPVHAFTHHGIFVADVVATNTDTGAMAGHARKTLAISTKETGETPPSGAHLARATAPAPAPAITTSSLSGKFVFSGTSTDTVTYTGSIQLPAGVDTSKPYEFWFAAGNIVTTAQVSPKGVGTDIGTPAILKSMKVTYSKLKKGAVTKGGEIAKVTATLSAAGFVTAGFNTEGISNTATDVGKGKKPMRTIQVAMLVDGAAYETQASVSFTISTDSSIGNISGRSSGK